MLSFPLISLFLYHLTSLSLDPPLFPYSVCSLNLTSPPCIFLAAGAYTIRICTVYCELSPLLWALARNAHIGWPARFDQTPKAQTSMQPARLYETGMNVALFHSKKSTWTSLLFDFVLLLFVEFALFSCFNLISSLFHFRLWGGGCSVLYALWRDIENVWDNAEMYTHL